MQAIRRVVVAAFVFGCGVSPTDPIIERQVRQRLHSEPSLRGAAIQVDSLSGEVWLLGRVPSLAHRARAEAIAERVGGVNFVRNQLRIALPPVSSPPPPGNQSSVGSQELGRPGQPMLVLEP
jgi:hypothetical protein